jgi:hypothetical protein
VRGVDPNDRFAGEIDKFFSNIVPLLPLSGTDVVLRERLIVELLAVIFSELFVRPFSNAIPSLPLRGTAFRLSANIAVASRMNSNSISRLILFPAVSFSQLLKYAVMQFLSIRLDYHPGFRG